MKKEEMKTKDNVDIENHELSDDVLDGVSGGGAFDHIPRVPVNKIDQNLKDKI